MTLKYLRDQRRHGAVADIATLKFPFPNDEFPNLETIVNEPDPRMSVGKWEGKDLFPDIVVIGRPGQWLRLMAEVETEDTVNEETAQTEWLPYSKQGDLLIYVPTGCVQETKRLCKRFGIQLKGIRTWRYQPVYGLRIAEA